jgi:hypothetical protein
MNEMERNVVICESEWVPMEAAMSCVYLDGLRNTTKTLSHGSKCQFCHDGVNTVSNSVIQAKPKCLVWPEESGKLQNAAFWVR